MTPRPEIITASNSTAAMFMWRRVRCSQIQKVARIRHEAGEAIDWAAFAFTATTERLWLRAGHYRSDDWKRTQSWPAANTATFLLYGRNAPFQRREDVPEHVWAMVEESVARGLACGHETLSPTAIAVRLGVTAAFRREHRLWMIGACDKSRHELREESKALAAERQRARRQADRERKAAQRRAAGMVERHEYLSAAALRREAIELAGISEATFKRRAPEVREALIMAARNELSLSDGQYNNNIVDADTLSSLELSNTITPAAPPAPVSGDIVLAAPIASSAPIATHARGRRMKAERTRAPYPFPPCQPVFINGQPVQTFLLTEQAADRAASAYGRAAETGCHVVSILHEQEHWLARMMRMHGSTPDEIADARAVMNRRFAEIVSAGHDTALPVIELPETAPPKSGARRIVSGSDASCSETIPLAARGQNLMRLTRYTQDTFASFLHQQGLPAEQNVELAVERINRILSAAEIAMEELMASGFPFDPQKQKTGEIVPVEAAL